MSEDKENTGNLFRSFREDAGTVSELIDALQKLPSNMPVFGDYGTVGVCVSVSDWQGGRNNGMQGVFILSSTSIGCEFYAGRF